MEESFHRKRGRAEVRVFSPGAQIGHCKCSPPLQRAMVDFGSEHSYEKAARNLKEHYGIEVPVSSIVRAGHRHGAQCTAFERQSEEGPCGTLICEMDGSMIPIVENDPGEGTGKDRRKHKETLWKEVKLCAVERQEDGTVGYAATLGCVEEAGLELYGLTLTAGAAGSTPIHGVGDGATWIKDQFDDLFGDRSSYLISFFHLCEYLAEASRSCRPEQPESWIRTQRKRMKKNQLTKVLEELEKNLEPASTPRTEAPVRRCYQYISNRPDQFNYEEALEQELPIGSGLIESGHRHVIQQRLKISGAWWKKQNAQRMLNLRVLRANGAWDAYWQWDLEIAA